MTRSLEVSLGTFFQPIAIPKRGGLEKRRRSSVQSAVAISSRVSPSDDPIAEEFLILFHQPDRTAF